MHATNLASGGTISWRTLGNDAERDDMQAQVPATSVFVLSCWSIAIHDRCIRYRLSCQLNVGQESTGGSGDDSG